MTAVAETGAIVLPASPAFYSQPRSLEDLVDTVVARILDRLEVAPKRDLVPRWR